MQLSATRSLTYKLRTLLQKIQLLGLSDESDEYLIQIIRLLNTVTLVTIGFGLGYIIISLFSVQFTFSLVVLCNSILVSIVFLLNHKKKFIASRLYFLVLVNLGLATNCFILGRESGIHFFYVVSASLPFIFFKHSELKFIIPSVSLSLVFFIIFQFDLIAYSYFQNLANQELIYNVSLISTFCWTLFNFYYIAHRNHNSLVAINEKNSTIKNALAQKSILLNEVHHRVKNNLQIIISLLYLQSQKTDDNKIKQMFEDFSHRLRSISSVHELLYSTNDFSKITVKTYIEKLIDDIQVAQQNNEISTSIDCDIEDISISLEDGIPLGLIVNEIVTNSLKYGIVNNSVNIKIQLTEKNGLIDIVLQDSGRGFDYNEQLNNSKSLGLFLVNGLAEQIGGEITTDISDKGSIYHIRFEHRAA